MYKLTRFVQTYFEVVLLPQPNSEIESDENFSSLYRTVVNRVLHSKLEDTAVNGYLQLTNYYFGHLTNIRFEDMSDILQKITNILESDYDSYCSGASPNSSELVSTCTDNIINIVKRTDLNDYSKVSPILDASKTFSIMVLYSKIDKEFQRKYFEYIGQVSKLKNLKILTENLEEIKEICVEVLKSVDSNTVHLDSDAVYLVSALIYSIGNLISNYPPDNTDLFLEHVVHLMMPFFEKNVSCAYFILR